MTDDLVKRLRDHIAVVVDNRGHVFEDEALCDDAADRIEELEAKLATAVEALELADNNLTNLQPKIANGLVRSDWVPVFDGYIDPVIQAARAALTQKDTVHD